jgi:hypothetical protein
MIHQKDHGSFTFSLWSEDLIELIEAATAIDYIAHHSEISELHI